MGLTVALRSGIGILKKQRKLSPLITILGSFLVLCDGRFQSILQRKISMCVPLLQMKETDAQRGEVSFPRLCRSLVADSGSVSISPRPVPCPLDHAWDV